jgi:beta-galactosidase GanA
MFSRLVGLALATTLLVGSPSTSAQTRPSTPHLEKRGDVKQLIVEGKPFLILGGELGNSTASNLDYLHPYWSKLKSMHLNTVLAPVYWELIEPGEEHFDFSSVDGLIKDAHAADMHLVLLWFGSWKNSMSTYVPSWIKRDQSRFPRAKADDGSTQEILSALEPNNWNADAKAFAALLAHLRSFDTEKTVLMIQVENEVGFLPSAREHGDAADRMFSGNVPAPLIRYLTNNREHLAPALREHWEQHGAKSKGTWNESFGSGAAAEEIFTAWQYAKYVEVVAAAGKRAYDIPLYLNVALNRPNAPPGKYPSGGAVPHLIDVWKAGAPSIDIIAPDVYFPNFSEFIAHYNRKDNTLFIPEANNAGRTEGTADALLAIGAHHAIGYSPFSIENVSDEGQRRIEESYGLLQQLTPLILEKQSSGSIRAARPVVSFDGKIDDSPQQLSLGDFAFKVDFIYPWSPKDQQNVAAHGVLIAQVDRDEYYVLGSGLSIAVTSKDARGFVGFDKVWEGAFDNGTWQSRRLLNGDQTHQGRRLLFEPDRFQIQRVKLYRYE